jgi:nicotinate phosphoribosyltransferase
MFDEEFLDYLTNLEFCCNLDAIPEGRVVFPQEPLIRVQGPIIQCQLIESALLNMLNYQSLVATKASRVCVAAGGDEVVEFGMRRAQGIDGALSASRAAYIGGCSATSNVMAAKLFGIPITGTHAHSWVMTFDNEIDAFSTYARALPDNCIFLIDTYDTIKGAYHAVQIGEKLREQGKALIGVRIDSGDLAYFSQKVREILDRHDFKETIIIASNNMDEHIVSSLKAQQAPIDVWGIGTKLVTAFDQPALGGVYKLSALKNGSTWEHKLKLSEQAAKVNNPGIQQVRRFNSNGIYAGDMIYDINSEIGSDHQMIDPIDHTRRKTMSSRKSKFEDLLVPVYRAGQLVYDAPDIHSIRQFVQEELSCLDKSIKRFVNPHIYSVGLEKGLFDSKTQHILKLRNLI